LEAQQNGVCRVEAHAGADEVQKGDAGLGSNPRTFIQIYLIEGIMKVFVVTYDTVYAYSDGTRYTGIEGVYSSRELAEQHIADRIADRHKAGAINETSYEIEECEVK